MLACCQPVTLLRGNADLANDGCPRTSYLRDGGAEGDRTPDLRNAIATLSQLSYGPTVAAP